MVEKKKAKTKLTKFFRGAALSAAMFGLGRFSNTTTQNDRLDPKEGERMVSIEAGDIGEAVPFVEMDEAEGFGNEDNARYSIHADWRGQFAEARDAGKIDKANLISTQEGWQAPIKQQDVLWSLHVGEKDFQTSYNALSKVDRTYFKLYLDIISEGLNDIAQMESPISAHQNTADVNALFQARYLAQMNRLLATDFTKDAKGNLSQEARDNLVEYQLAQMAYERILGPALTMVLIPEYGMDSIKDLQRGIEELKDPTSGKKLLQNLNPTTKKTSARRPAFSHGHDAR